MPQLIVKTSAFLCNTSVDSHESPTTFSRCNIILHQWWSNLIWFMNENLFMFSHCLKFHHTIHDTTASMHQQVLAIRMGFWLTACCKLALTLARKIWRHNYVIGRSEYLISTLLASTVPWIYSLHFLFKSAHHSLRYKRNCEWVFFSEHSVLFNTHVSGYREVQIKWPLYNWVVLNALFLK